MINCNIHNYREYIEAYLNEKLTGEDMLAVESFLQQHPNIMDEYLLELEEIKLKSINTPAGLFSHLNIKIDPTKNIHANNYTQYFVNYYEEELANADKIETEKFVQLNPSLQKEFKTYSSAYLKADSSINYPDKNSLYKKARPAISLFGSIAAAASIALVITIYIFGSTSHQPNAIALKDTHKTTIPWPSNVKAEFNTNSVNNNMVIHQQNEKAIRKNKAYQSIQQKEDIHYMVADLVDMNLNSPVVIPIISPSLANGQPQTALNDIELYNNNPVAENNPRKKGFFEKLLSGDKIYIEEYVNATFTAFNEKPEGSDWVLKVERDESGKSKRIKFSSPIFSIKSKN